MRHWVYFLSSSFLFIIQYVYCQDKKALKCSACKAVVDEIEYAIKQVDPKKQLEIESFRVDPRGNQKTKSIPYARSETHLTEILESVCDEMKSYAKSTNKETGQVSYVRTDSRDGKPVTLENVSMSTQESDKLKHACQSVLDDFDEDMVEFFKTEDENAKETFCADATHICEKEEENDDEEEEEAEKHSEL